MDPVRLGEIVAALGGELQGDRRPAGDLLQQPRRHHQEGDRCAERRQV